MMVLAMLALAVMFGLGAGTIAHDRARNPFRWFVAGCLVGPFSFAVVVLPPGPARRPYRTWPPATTSNRAVTGGRASN